MTAYDYRSAADQEANVAEFVHPNTSVYTKNGPKLIKDIKLSDVLSSGAKLSDIFELPFDGSLVNINGNLVGPGHKLSVLQSSQQALKHGVVAPKWLPASAIAVGDYLEFSTAVATETLPLSSEVCWLIGVITGQGQKAGNRVQVPYSQFIDRLIEHLQETAIPYISSKSGAVLFESPINLSLIFKPDGSKSLAPKILHMTAEQSKAFTSGLEQSTAALEPNITQLDSASLAVQVQFMYLQTGVLTKVDGKGQLAKVETENWFAHGNSLFQKVVQKEQYKYSGPVYDLQIAGGLGEDPDTQPSYMTSGGLHHNGGGKRNGSIAVYLEPWHADVMDFVALKRNHGDEALRCRDLFLALWINDLFMKRVEADGIWSLMCPNTSPGLSDVFDKDKDHMDFTNLYERYEAEGKFMKQIKARELWDAIIVSQIETGVPYMLYKDSVNRKSNQSNLGTIKSSNLCVAPDTMILTSKGYFPIKELHKQEVEVWNGEQFSKTTVMKTGEYQEMLNVSFSNGLQLECTPYHKFHIKEGGYQSKKTAVVDAKDLEPGMKLVKTHFPLIDKASSPEEFPHPYTHGFYCGDGTTNNKHEHGPKPCSCFAALPGKDFCKRHLSHAVLGLLNGAAKGDCQAMSDQPRPAMSLYTEKKKLLPFFDILSTSGNEDGSGRINCQLPLDLPEKFSVPFNTGLNTRLDWLSGLCDADGTVVTVGGNESVQIASTNVPFLQKIILLLQTLGVDAKIGLVQPKRRAMLPDGQGGLKEYDCEAVYRVIIVNADVNSLLTMGFQPKRLQLTGAHKPQRSAKRFVQVQSVEPLAALSDTYCFKEPLRGMGVFNGLNTGNCCEIMEYSSPEETSVCNLASVALKAFVRCFEDKPAEYDFHELHKIIKVMTRNLNNVIDINYYPVETARNSNMKHRPIGLGVQGLADAFMMMRYPFESAEAQALNKDIFETIYHAALEASCEMAAERETEILEYKQLAAIDDKPKELKRQLTQILKKTKFTQEELTREKCRGSYDSYLWNGGCPLSKGIFQFDMWDVKPSDRWNWDTLSEQIDAHGVRNSLLVAPMPTASTSQILNNFECFEAPTSNIFTRRTLAGEFIVANKYMLRDLIDRGLWTESIRARVVAAGGSIQDIEEIPDDIKALYKTMWEVKMRTVIDMARDRGAFVDQSQSMNLYMANPTLKNMTSMHFYAWKAALKTGVYYCRTRAKARPQQFTVDPLLLAKTNKAEAIAPTAEEVLACSLENKEACQMCSG